jgi:electron transport complex protein RnfA
MSNLALIFIGAFIVNNVLLSQFLGLCSFLGVSKKTSTAVGMGGAVTFVITIASVVAGLLYKYILVPTGFEYLDTIVFILVIAALVQVVEMFLKKNVPSLYQALGVYLPLITTNCAVLGVALKNVTNNYNILQGVVYGLGTGLGYFLAIVILAGIREKYQYNEYPKYFKGTAMTLITAGLMSMAFFGFSGMI